MDMFLNGAIAIGVVMLLGCVGEIITEKSGHLNLGIPGIMCMGGAGGTIGVSIYFTSVSQPQWIWVILIGIFCSIVFSLLASFIYGFLTVTLRSNQNVTGLALTTFGAGFAQFAIKQYVDLDILRTNGAIFRSSLSFAGDLGWFGNVFLNHGILVYIAVVIAILSAVVLNKTRAGLKLRAVGENPATADAVGINVTKYKYFAILIGGAIAGLGGLLYVMNYQKGSDPLGGCTDVQAFGWLAIALVIFTVWKPNLSILGSFVFGALYILAYQGLKFDTNLLKLLPYVITLIVLIITSITGSKNIQPPASLGLNYFREER